MKKNLYIFKIGGNVIDDKIGLEKFLSSFSKIKTQKILIHGGGKMANELAEKLGIKQNMVNGKRVTDSETLKIVTMVYAGLINKAITATLQSLEQNAIGLSGADLNIIKTRKRRNKGINYGFVGDVEKVNNIQISTLIENNFLPVICPITHDGKGQLLNTNADTVACAIAIALSKKYNTRLIYCFEKNGVLKNITDEKSCLKSISKKEYATLLNEGLISKGMIPKLDNSFAAIDNGVKNVIIGNAKNLNKLINNNCGTILTS